MHPNTTLTNKISVILINLKIINGYNFVIKLFTADLLNTESISVIINKLCTYPKLFGIYKAFIFYVKRMVVCSYDFFTVYCKVNQSVYLSDICFKNRFTSSLKCIRIGWDNLSKQIIIWSQNLLIQLECVYYQFV